MQTILRVGLLTLVLATVATPARAQTPPDRPLTLGFQRIMKSEVLGESRSLLVKLPRGYDAQDETRYPLFVVFDARGNFTLSAAMIESMISSRMVPPMIVVGIMNNNRWRDLSPVKDLGVASSGGGAVFLECLKTEIIPYIDATWKTNGFRVISGHSLGGLTAFNILANEPDLFDAYLALAPSMEWADGFMLDQFREKLPKSFNSDKILFMSIGDEREERVFYDQMVEFLQARAPENLIWSSHLFDEEIDHMAIRLPGALVGLTTIFRDWRLTPNRFYEMTNEEIEAHDAVASRRYKEPREQGVMETTNAAYYGLYEAETVDRAMELFHLAVKKWPNNGYVHSCLGEGLERTGDLEGALKEMELALQLIKARGWGDMAYFEGMINRVKEKLGR